jgi:hypothetical protein
VVLVEGSTDFITHLVETENLMLLITQIIARDKSNDTLLRSIAIINRILEAGVIQIKKPGNGNINGHQELSKSFRLIFKTSPLGKTYGSEFELLGGLEALKSLKHSVVSKGEADLEYGDSQLSYFYQHLSNTLTNLYSIYIDDNDEETDIFEDYRAVVNDGMESDYFMVDDCDTV